MSWTAIWNHSGPVFSRDDLAPTPGLSTFLIEARGSAQPKAQIWTGSGPDAVTVDTHADGSIALSHGAQTWRTMPGLIYPGEAFRLTYRAGPQPELDVHSLNRDARVHLAADAGQPLARSDVQPAHGAMPGFDGIAALANTDAPLADAPGLEVGTPVMTAAGTMAVDDLHPGDVVIMGSGRPAIVASTARTEAISVGSMGAVRLRAPYFGLTRDVFLARNTCVRLSGPEVDYTCGEDAVMATASDLVTGISILRDLTAPLRDFVTVRLDRPGCLRVGRLQIAGSDADQSDPKIDRRTARTLMSMTRDGRDLVA